MGRADPARCVPGEDLTAFAHGELSDAARARVSAHVLRCDACRGALDATRALLRSLRGLDLSAAPRRASPWVGARGRVAAAAAFAGLVGAAWALAPAGPAGAPSRLPPPAIAAAAAAPHAADLGPLLAAQEPDGRWTAGAASESRDEAATALALLALVPRARASIARGDAARAVAAGTRWLLARQRSDGRLGSADPGSEDHAIATAALLAVHDATHDERVRVAADRAVRRLARDDGAGGAPGSVSALRWSVHALARARSLGWSRVEASLREVEDRLLARGERPGDDAPVAGTEAWSEGRRDGAGIALRILRDARG